MPDTRLTFDPQHCLPDVDTDITDEFNALLDAATAAKDKFTGLSSLVRKLKNALENKNLELERVARQHAADTHDRDTTITRLEGRFKVQCQTVQKQKQQMERLRRRGKQLDDDLRTSNKKLEQMQHLRCDVCQEDVKAVVTRCGHGFCKACLHTHFRVTGRSGLELADLTSTPFWMSRCRCPTCRAEICRKTDVWCIYLGAGTESVEAGETEDGSD